MAAHSIQDLTKIRREWVRVNRKNNFEKGIKRLLTDLYPDNAHFIYELLQNAEDAQASSVKFTLTNRDVKFEHNGGRPFNISDVDSITSIGVSTKHDDHTSIGKFGVGFKAVFAYTETPEVHSGNIHFKIHDLVVPETDGVMRPQLGDNMTRFVFPLNHPTKSKTKAKLEIGQGLKQLDDSTLLFLNHIRSIKYRLPDGATGRIERVNLGDGRIEIVAHHQRGKQNCSNWLRFHKMVDVVDDGGNKKPCRVAIAYRLESTGSGTDSMLEIVPTDRGRVSIYFPAEKETSNLRFHLHAPFASTVARDSVRDCSENNQLRDGLLELILESLESIRDNGLLGINFLSVLPNEHDNLSSFYEPIREAIVKAFTEKSLTPTKSGEHAPASALYRGPARVSEVITDNDLSLMTRYDLPLWAANPPQRHQDADRFLDSLGMDVWGWPNLLGALKRLDDFGTWVSGKDDEWLMRLYALLGEASSVHRERIDVAELSIIRVRTPQGFDHVLPKKAFLPPANGSRVPAHICLVKPDVYDISRSPGRKKNAAIFLEEAGVRRYDEKAIIEMRLDEYDGALDEPPSGYYQDLAEFIKYWRKNPGETAVFMHRQFLLVDSSKTICWKSPEQICLDIPYLETNLGMFKDVHGKSRLSGVYHGNLDKLSAESFVNFLRAIGVMCELKVSNASIYMNPAKLHYKFPNTRDTYTRTAVDYNIDSLPKYIKAESRVISSLIWHAVIKADKRVAKAKYSPNQSHTPREADSQLIYHLKGNPWIPDKEGVFRTPQEMSRDDLRDDFPYINNNGLLTVIGFGKNALERSEEFQSKNQHAQDIGFADMDEANHMVELANILRKNSKNPKELLEKVKAEYERPAPNFPERKSSNPDRRRERASERYDDAPEREYQQRERSVRISSGAIDPRTYLRNQYTDDDLMVCQICKEVMPFRGRDRKHYFEAVELLARHSFPKEFDAQYIALCPLCAAKYKEWVKHDPKKMDDIQDDLIETTGREISIFIGDFETSIRFTESHLIDLKSAFEGMGATSNQEHRSQAENDAQLNDAEVYHNQELRDDLLILRRNKIESIGGECDDNHILSDKWIERFISRKPTSREEFQIFFEEKWRSSMSGGRWLDLVLKKIEDHQ